MKSYRMQMLKRGQRCETYRSDVWLSTSRTLSLDWRKVLGNENGDVRRTSQIISQVNCRNIYFIQGEDYLCKIAGFGFNDEVCYFLADFILSTSA